MLLSLPFGKRLAGLALLLTLLATAAPAQVLDPTFQPTDLRADFQSNEYIMRAMAVQPDGKVVISGDYTLLDGVVTSTVRRLNADGSADAAFLAQTGTGPDATYATALAVQPDGKILAAGQFNYYSNAYTGGLVRLNADGSRNASFNAGGAGFVTGVGGSELRTLALQPDGKILVGGTLVRYNGVAVSNVIRLFPDGTLDASFAPAANALRNAQGGDRVDAILVQADGKIVVGGTLPSIAGTTLSGLARFLPNGSLDASFAVGTGAAGSTGTQYAQVRALLQQPDGKLLVGGTFAQFNTAPAGSLLRLNLDGTVDSSFQPGVLPTGAGVYHLRRRPDGSLLVSGQFATYNGAPRGGIALLSSTGTLDATFATAGGAPTLVYDLLDLPGGQLLAGGQFTTFQGAAHTGLVRLSSNGTLDASYNPVYAQQGTLNTVVPLTTGQLLIQGRFNSFNGTPVPAGALVRLHANGGFDTAIVPAATGTYFPQPDGRIYVCNESNVSSLTLKRLLPTGAVDPSFPTVTLANAASGPYFFTRLLALPNGQLLLSGSFSAVAGQARNRVVRLNADGTVDPTFVPTVTWPLGNSNMLVLDAVQADGKLLLRSYDNQTTQVLRLRTDGSSDPSFGTNGVLSFSSSIILYPLPNGQLLQSESLVVYSPLGTPLSLTRLNADGSPDASFVRADAGAVTLQPDGRLLVWGTDYNTGRTLVRRLEANGRPDASFTTIVLPTGYFYGTGITTLALQPTDGKIVLAGGFATVNGQQRLGLARLTNTLLAAQPALPAAPALDLFPNPAHHRATLRLPAAPTPRPAQLLDALGRPVRAFTVPAHATETAVDVAGLPAGVYVLRCGTASRRLVVE